MSFVGIGIIGCGTRLATLLGPLLKQSDRLRLTGLCDPAPDQVRLYCDRFNSEHALDGLKAALTCFALDQATSTGEVVDLRHLWSKAGIVVA